jgi:hypothetical protein
MALSLSTASDFRVWAEEEDFLLASPCSGVPAVVFLAVPFALPRVFAAIVGSVADVALRFAVFWRHRLVVARAWRVPALAAAGLPGVPATASREADPVLAGAWCPIGRLSTVVPRAAEEAEPRWDGQQGESRADCQGPVEMGCSGLTGDPPGDQADDLWVVQCSVALAGRQGDPVDGSEAVPGLALLA